MIALLDASAGMVTADAGLQRVAGLLGWRDPRGSPAPSTAWWKGVLGSGDLATDEWTERAA